MNVTGIYQINVTIANQLKRKLTDLIMSSTDLALPKREYLIKTLNVVATENGVKIISNSKGMFEALNFGTPKFRRPYNWVQRAMDSLQINVLPVTVDIIKQAIGGV